MEYNNEKTKNKENISYKQVNKKIDINKLNKFKINILNRKKISEYNFNIKYNINKKIIENINERDEKINFKIINEFKDSENNGFRFMKYEI